MSSNRGRVADRAVSVEFVRWWWRWWMDTRGKILGLLVPAWFALVGIALGAAAVPFALACGLAPRCCGRWGRGARCSRSPAGLPGSWS